MTSRLRQLAALAFGLLSSVACNVATVDQVPSTITQNTCSGDSDCAGGECVNSSCRSRSGTFEKLLFEVTPPADHSLIAGVQFLVSPEKPLRLDGEANLALDLGLVSQVVGKVIRTDHRCTPKFDDMGTELAIAGDSTIPAFITLTPSMTALGLSSPKAVVKSVLIKSSYFSFSVNVPPGDYDIYVEPEHQIDDSCPVPPQLRRNQQIKGGTTLGLEVPLSKPSSFEFHVSWPLADGKLNGWFVDMLDPVSGRVISNRVQLAVANIAKTDYVATLAYAVVGPTSEQAAEELVRLSPPGDMPAPTILLARSALGLFDADKGTLDRFTSLPTPVRLQGQVAAQSTARPVAATVTLVATKITGIDPGVLASFVRTVVVGANGQFELDVLPGTYRVSAVPSVELNGSTSADPDSKLGEVTQQWEVPSSPAVQAGKVVTLGEALPIKGTVLDAARTTAVATALVQAVASPASLQADVLHQALGETSLVPRSSSSSVSTSGDFELRADPGTFDVSVRPLASTGFGWLVSPNVSVGTTPANSAGANLNALSIPLAVSYSGTVTVPGMTGPKLVPNALIRAYIYMSRGQYVSDPKKADSVLQVAETRADQYGNFEVLIPAAVNAPTQ